MLLPGNAGTSKIAENIDLSLTDFLAIKDFCLNKKIDLVFVGPEQPIVDGIVEYLEKYNIFVIAPDSFCAKLESSKSFTKEICDIKNIKTAKYEVFTDAKNAISYIKNINLYPQVIKADGLAAGKGVIIAKNFMEAETALQEIFSGKFGKMDKVVIEEFLEGVEVSVFAISDGNVFKLLSNAGDHKRVGDGDTGLNTGGMGAYSPSPYLTLEKEQEVIDNILKPTFAYLKEQNHPYKGVLFAGLMITKDQEIYLIEYNIRFGDPETQSILPRFDGDFLELCQAVKEQSLSDMTVVFSDKKAITIVLSAKGYPESYNKGAEISLDNLDTEKIKIFHAGTKKDGNKLLANGGRVLNVTALAEDFSKAREIAYQEVKKVMWVDKYYRTDIAKKVI